MVAVSINSTSEEVRSKAVADHYLGLFDVSINSTSEEVRSFFNRRTLMRERLQFPLIQLPRKSEDLYPVFQSTENVSINSTSEEVRREKIQPCC